MRPMRARVQRRQPVLEHHRDARVTQLAHCRLAQLQQVDAIEQHLAADDAPGRAAQAQQ
jgi:hypothetical protein